LDWPLFSSPDARSLLGSKVASDLQIALGMNVRHQEVLLAHWLMLQIALRRRQASRREDEIVECIVSLARSFKRSLIAAGL
jgi:hypothetical protein